MASGSQEEFDFGSAQESAGFLRWRQERQEAIQALARKMGLPIGHPVELWLRDGVRLKGRLLLQEERLFIEEARDFHLMLVVDGVPFEANDIESCVRMD